MKKEYTKPEAVVINVSTNEAYSVYPPSGCAGVRDNVETYSVAIPGACTQLHV